MGKNLDVLHLYKNCRTCLKELDENKHDFEKLSKEVFRVFKQITGFRKNEKLLYPKCLCDSCHEQIKNFSELKNKTIENQRILMDLVDSYMEKFVTDSATETQAQVEMQISHQSEEVQSISNKNNMEGIEGNEASEISKSDNFQNLFLEVEIKEETHEFDIHNSNLADNLLLINFQETNVNILSSNNKMENDLDIHNSNLPDNSTKNSQEASVKNLSNSIKIKNELGINNSNVSDTLSIRNSQENNVSSSSSSIENKENHCKVCNSTYSTAALLETHMKIHKEKQPFTCKLCESSFDKKSLYNRHMKECHAETPKYYNAALESGRRITRSRATEKDYTNQQILHTNDLNEEVETVKGHDKSTKDDSSDKSAANMISCKFCHKVFFSASALRMHKRLHKEEDQFQCTECGKSFKSPYLLKKHTKQKKHTNKPLKTFTKHRNIQHMLPQRVPKPKKNNNFACEICGRVFSCMVRLREHSYSHRPIEDRPYKCEQCGKTFVFKSTYDEHLVRHTGIKNFECPQCGLRKATKSDLRRHIKTHTTNDKTYPCPICSKVFSMVNLGAHNRLVHQGIKRFKCTECNKAFGTSIQLKYHIMGHTGERPHKCQICDRGFVQAMGLRSHMKRHNK